MDDATGSLASCRRIKDLGFTDADRVENLRRASEVAKLMVDAGLIVIVSFISPFESERRMARDPKQLYAKARRGELSNFTGVDSPYERPTSPEIAVDTSAMTADAAAEAIIARLSALGLIHEV